MTRFIKNILIFSVIIVFGLGILVYVSKYGVPSVGSDEELDFGEGSDFLSPGSTLR